MPKKQKSLKDIPLRISIENPTKTEKKKPLKKPLKGPIERNKNDSIETSDPPDFDLIIDKR